MTTYVRFLARQVMIPLAMGKSAVPNHVSPSATSLAAASFNKPVITYGLADVEAHTTRLAKKSVKRFTGIKTMGVFDDIDLGAAYLLVDAIRRFSKRSKQRVRVVENTHASFGGRQSMLFDPIADATFVRANKEIHAGVLASLQAPQELAAKVAHAWQHVPGHVPQYHMSYYLEPFGMGQVVHLIRSLGQRLWKKQSMQAALEPIGATLPKPAPGNILENFEPTALEQGGEPSWDNFAFIKPPQPLLSEAMPTIHLVPQFPLLEIKGTDASHTVLRYFERAKNRRYRGVGPLSK